MGIPRIEPLTAAMTPSGTSPPASGRMMRTTPMTIICTASVAMIGFTLSRVTATPFTKPMNAATTKTRGISKMGDPPIARMAVVRLITAPTERSSPPRRITIIWPMATMIKGMACATRLDRFCGLANRSVLKASQTAPAIAINKGITQMPCRELAPNKTDLIVVLISRIPCRSGVESRIQDLVLSRFGRRHFSDNGIAVHHKDPVAEPD